MGLMALQENLCSDRIPLYFVFFSLSLSLELLLIKKPNDVHARAGGPAQEMSNVIQKDERNISEQQRLQTIFNIYPQTTGGARISRNGWRAQYIYIGWAAAAAALPQTTTTSSIALISGSELKPQNLIRTKRILSFVSFQVCSGLGRLFPAIWCMSALCPIF
jgi:hypothetical protein